MDVGIVVDNIDPAYVGRCRVRVLGKHTQRQDPNDNKSPYIIPDDCLPWAIQGDANNEFCLPKVGDIVRVDYDRDKYSPVYYRGMKPGKDVVEKITNPISNYKSAHIIIYDTCLDDDLDEDGNQINNKEGEYIKMYYVDSEGFVIDMNTENGQSKITIDKSAKVTISSKDNSNITIDGTEGRINITTDNDVTVNAQNVNINGESIKLGKDAVKRLVTEDIMTLFNNHTHNYHGSPTTTSDVKMTSAHLTKKTKSK